MRLLPTSYGPAASACLAELVAAAKGNDALAPVTVVVPHNYAGVSARRALGRASVSGSRRGVAAVGFLTPYRLAELLGGPRLAAQRRRPVSTALLAAAVRAVLADAPGVFAAVRDHPTTESTLVRAHRDLCELPPPALDRLAAQGPRAADVVRIHREVRGRLASRWYVETDLAAAAVAAIADGATATVAGPVVWFLPQRLAPSAARMARALAGVSPTAVIAGLTGEPDADATVIESLHRLGFDQAAIERARRELLARSSDDGVAAATAAAPAGSPDADATAPVSAAVAGGLRVVSASDADEEVRAVVRAVVDAARAGVGFDEMAVLHPGREPYARLVHEQLGAAGIPFNGTTPRRLADSVVGRTLLGFLALPDRDFRRVDVMALLASAPIRWEGRAAPASAWERISRAAGVVGGVAEFEARLGRYAAERRNRASDEAAGEGRDGVIAFFEREASLADALAGFVTAAAQQLDDTRPVTWRQRARWAARMVQRLLGEPSDDWPELERAAADKVAAALDRLAGLDEVGDAPTASVFRRTLAHELDGGLGRVGRLGDGVLVTGLADAVGVDLRRVMVLGMAEGTFPPRVRDDSLLPDRERAVVGGELALRSARTGDDHRHLLAALAAADDVTVTWPRGDLRRSNERTPSRWLPPPAGDVPMMEVPSHVGGLAAVEFPATVHEFDLRCLLDAAAAGDVVHEHPVLHRRPALGRGVEMVRARRSDSLTRFDGHLGPRPELDPTGDDRVVSATRLEAWVRCPFAYLMRYVLGVEPVDDVAEQLRVSPLDKGTVVHEVLDEFLTEVLDRPRADQPAPSAPWTAADHERLDEIAAAHLDRLESRGLAGRAVFWRPERASIARQLHRFLAADAEYRAATGARPRATELPFGLPGASQPPLRWLLPDGRVLRFRGSADRVDDLPGGALAVVDYKTGKPDSYRVVADDPDRNGTVLQLPVYAQAARAAAGSPDAPVHAAYWFVSDRGRYRQVGYPVTDEVIARFDEVLGVIADGITAGAFVAHPDEPASFVPYVTCHYCDPDGGGTRHRHLEWERKRHDPVVAGYLGLIDPELAAPGGHAAVGRAT